MKKIIILFVCVISIICLASETNPPFLSGYANIAFNKFQNSSNTFNNAKLVFDLTHELHRKIFFDSELEFAALSNLSSDQARDTSGDIKFNKIHLDLKLKKIFNLRAGVILVPFGLYNLIYHSPDRDLVSDPLLTTILLPVPYSDLGVGFYGMTNLFDLIDIGYDFYILNGLNENISATEGIYTARPSFVSDNNNDKSLVGKISLSSFDIVKLGLSGYFGGYDDNTEADLVGADFDWELIFDKLKIFGEYGLFYLEDGGTLTDASGVVYPDNIKAFYIEVDNNFWFDFLSKTFLAKGFSNPTLTLVFRYDRGVINGNASYKESKYIMGLNYRPIEKFVFKIEYQINSGNLENADNDGVLVGFALNF
jgi:hypothetical protein